MAGGERDVQALKVNALQDDVADLKIRVDALVNLMMAMSAQILRLDDKRLCGKVNGGFVCQSLAGTRCPDCKACHDVGEGS